MTGTQSVVCVCADPKQSRQSRDRSPKRFATKEAGAPGAMRESARALTPVHNALHGYL